MSFVSRIGRRVQRMLEFGSTLGRQTWFKLFGQGLRDWVGNLHPFWLYRILVYIRG